MADKIRPYEDNEGRALPYPLLINAMLCIDAVRTVLHSGN